jgi:endoglucanase
MRNILSRSIYFLFIILLSCKEEIAEIHLDLSEDIRLNQIGFYPNLPKLAVITAEVEADNFYLLQVDDQKVIHSGKLVKSKSSSGKSVYLADFSDFNEKGRFVVHVQGVGHSPQFHIAEQPFEDLGKASIKAFYYNRASTELEEQYAGIWARPLGHPDDRVFVHASAATEERPEETILSMPKGWYDAGDYNKYIVNSGITMGTLLSLYEDFPAYHSSLKLNLPESDNEVPDLLDEVLWNLQWMIKMQDPHDGGVYHKLTAAKFEGTVMPHEAQSTRYVVAKSTAATLDFAAVMAQAARVYRDFYPDMAIECLKAAETAWIWARNNPEVLYEQNEMNKKFQPAIETGAYGNRQLDDEWVWAASELYISTHNKEYLDFISHPESFELPNWGNVSWLGYYSLLRFSDELKYLPVELMSQIKHQLLQKTEEYVAAAAATDYRVVMGHQDADFVWGSNSVAANQGVALLQAYLLTGEAKYLNHALGNLDYILGRNATGYSYVTGFGHKSPQDPHHRPSAAMADIPPVPGFMVGGPNPGQQDACNYSSAIPAESYVDSYCSYASNEVAINWNAPFAYLVNALEASL